ncbi:MAG: MBL fold metallo-hydrolase [bacterium]
MQLEFHGAAREVTGSCHILRVNGQTILLDCGLFQGKRADVLKKNHQLPVDPHTISAVVLSHAHIDHAGRIPFLVHEGYKGPIHATTATRDLCEVMLADSAHIQEKDAEFLSRRKQQHAEPLYGSKDVVRTLELMQGTRYGRVVDVAPGVKATFLDAGHILGSASVLLECTEGNRTVRLVFSGDIGRVGLPIIRDPVVPERADLVIMESTYGNREHPSTTGGMDALAKVVRETAARGGKVLIPAFAVGRTQELVYDLHQLAEQGKIPRMPIVIDSPLATKATAVFEKNTAIFDDDEPFVRSHRDDPAGLFKFPLLRFTESVEESKALDTTPGPAVIIAASGMAESGRILHHLSHGAADPRNTILVVGFMAEHTLGRRIVEKQPLVKVYGDEVPLRAQVEIISGYSAHAGRSELHEWIRTARAQSATLRDVWLVHGEPEAQDAFAALVTEDGLTPHCPTPGTRVDL